MTDIILPLTIILFFVGANFYAFWIEQLKGGEK